MSRVSEGVAAPCRVRAPSLPGVSRPIPRSPRAWAMSPESPHAMISEGLSCGVQWESGGEGGEATKGGILFFAMRLRVVGAVGA